MTAEGPAGYHWPLPPCREDIDRLAPPWKREEPEEIADARIFTLRRIPSRSPQTGEVHDFFQLAAPHWVNIVSLTEEGDMLFVVQQRHGIDRATLEVPAGLVDDGEDPRDAALRELEEETGYVPREIIHIGTSWSNPAFMNNRCFTFLARDCRPSGTIRRDTTEELQFVLIPGSQVQDLLSSGMLGNAMGIVALYWYELHCRGICWKGDDNMVLP